MSDKVEIPIIKTHICSPNCAYTTKMIPSKNNPKIYKITRVENEHYVNGKCPASNTLEETCIHIASYENPNDNTDTEVVISDTQISITFSYPLKKAFKFDFKSSNGFTRPQLYEIICNKYREIYQKEEETTTKNVTSVEERIQRGGLINRETTDGFYGIQGHDISDLYIERLEYDTQTKELDMFIGS